MKINNLDKAEVLVALYNAVKVKRIKVGMNFFSDERNFIIDKEKAAQLLATRTRFDYLKGKILKVDLSGDELDTYLYNRENGSDAAENAIKPLLEQAATFSIQ